MEFFEILKVILLGIVEGITEWLPISSTGHMKLLNALPFMELKGVSVGFMDMFEYVIQLAAILAVVILFWKLRKKQMRVFYIRLMGLNFATLTQYPMTHFQSVKI